MRRRLRGQEGSALPAAIAVLAVLSVLSAGVAANAVEQSDTSNTDRDSKRALEAAEAGLQAGTYRLNKLAPATELCVTNIATLPIAGKCPSFTQTLGNGSQYTYYVTPILSLGQHADQCAGLPLQYDGGNGTLTIAQRCVTSTGEANGVKRRVQARVAAFKGTPIYPLGGILGLNGVNVKNSATVNGEVGSNGQITLGNSSAVQGIQLGPAAPEAILGNNSTSQQQPFHRTNTEGPWVLAPVDVGNSATTNDNARISGGQDASTGTTYTAGTRTLTMGNNASITLGGGTYNFCRMTIGNGAVITIAANAKVRIFIDSPDRDGSGCPAGTGDISVGQNSTFSNPSGVPENLQIYIYGLNNGNQSISFNNTGTIVGSIYAPQSKIVFTNSATINGGVSAKFVDFKNSVNFTWFSSLASLSARTLTLYFRTSWKECLKNPTDAADPQSGCT